MVIVWIYLVSLHTRTTYQAGFIALLLYVTSSVKLLNRRTSNHSDYIMIGEYKHQLWSVLLTYHEKLTVIDFG